MFTLAKLAYAVCDERERRFYDELETPDVQPRSCCVAVMEYLKNETDPDSWARASRERSRDDYWPEQLSIIDMAAYHGHAECFAFAEQRGFPLTSTVCTQAAANGQLAFLAYVREWLGCPWDGADVYAAAAAGGHVDCLRYAVGHGYGPRDATACAAAAKRGRLRCLEYLRAAGFPWDESTCEAAAGNGHLDALAYAHENGCPWDADTCRAAARNGHLDALEYAHRNGCPWDEYTSTVAAGNGHLDALAYAHENGCPWDESTCEAAAGNGHLNTLMYAHQNGCPWDEDAFAMAVMFRRSRCAWYILENTGPRQFIFMD